MKVFNNCIQERKVWSDRISLDQALDDFVNADISELMYRADQIRKAKHGRKVHFVHSLNINPTNICKNKCKLCAFWKEEDSEEGYVISLEQATQSLRESAGLGLTDLHVVGGLTEQLRLDYYLELFRRAKIILPSVIIQGLTAVEIHWLAKLEKTSIHEVLQQLKSAGLDAIPGGGAEIFNDTIRQEICSNKISAEQWLDVHKQAHELGIASNATILFGHIEKSEHIIEHLFQLRDLQDITGGFLAFCPLPFHPGSTQIEVSSAPGGYSITRMVAMARIVLDNFPHIRVLANYMERKLLQTMLFSGADDVGGTSINEQIARAAGAGDDSKFSSPKEMENFILNLELEPVLCNSIYKQSSTRKHEIKSNTITSIEIYKDILDKAENGQRLSLEEAVILHDKVPFHELGRLANKRRHEKVPDKRCTFIIDRNISFTNVCTVGCKFCAFHVLPNNENSFVMSIDEIVRRVVEAVELGATQIMLQGGLNPTLDLPWYEDMLKSIKKKVPDIWLHSLSPAEIYWLAQKNKLSVIAAMERLRNAGLDSLPGGGAEILVDEIRQNVSPRKLTVGQWFEVMEAAHSIGMSTTATMVYGLGETTAQRVEHMIKVRELQDKTGGFRAFIPWSFQPNHTKLSYPLPSGVDYLRIVALARLVLDNVDHVQAGWVTEGPDMVELALKFGADDFGGVLMEESVVSATGLSFGMSVEKIISSIHNAGFTPAVRNTQYNLMGIYDENNQFIPTGAK
ncbi:MAG: dehypoxanthine futalosine cyclase [Sedimentisphaerales bacterium]|nr:dehypoxanthine futalosine cyclase [Sedimentisphaerales bacterium]